MDTVRRRSITLPPLYDDMVAEYAAERGMGFSPALVMLLELLRSDPRLAKSLPDKSPAKPATNKPAKPPQWDDETEAESFERFQVESRMNTDPRAVARVQARYEDHGLTEIVWREKPNLQK